MWAVLGMGESVVRSREKLEGVALDVGLPIIDTRSFKTGIQLPLDSWVAFQCPDLGDGSRFLFLKVAEVPADAEE